MDRQHLFEGLLDTLQDGILFLAADHTIVVANRWIEEKLAAHLPLVGRKCYEVLERRPDLCPECPVRTTGAPCDSQTRVVSHIDHRGAAEWFEVTTYPLTDPAGGAAGSIAHIRDVTEQKQTEELLKNELARRRILVEQSRDGIVVLDRQGRVYEANQAYARMLGYSLQEVYQLGIWDWNTDYRKEELLALIEAVDDAGDHFETRHRRKDGTYFDVEISSNGAVIGGKKLVFCVCRDISEKNAMEHRIRELAVRDPLTGVYNRRYIFERLGEMVAEHERGGAGFCVSIIDLDHFKLLNDTHGHLAGDFVLKEFTRIIGGLIRQYDLLGRYGGEEFIIVSKNAPASDTAAMIERLMQAVRRRTVSFEGRRMRFTFSCGLADSSEIPSHAFSIESLLSLADRRLYEAKAAGRNRWVGPLAVAPLR